MNWKTATTEEKIEAYNVLKRIRELALGCPPKEWRVEEHTKCFYCNECQSYALMNMINSQKE